MEVLYSLNITVAVFLLCWQVWFSRSVLRLPWINPWSLVVLVTFPVEFMRLVGGTYVLSEQGLFDPGYQYALLMNSLQLFIYLLGSIFFFKVFCRMSLVRYLPGKKTIFGPKALKWTAAFLGVVSLAAFIKLASSDFGLAKWLLHPREGYMDHRKGLGVWYELSVDALSASFAFSFLATPKVSVVLRNLLIYTFFAYFLASKGLMLAIFGSTLVCLWFLRWPYLKKVLVYGLPLIFVLLIGSIYLVLGSDFDLKSAAADFDPLKNAADYYRGYLNHRVDLFHGQVFMTSFWVYVPREIFPDKPWVYGTLWVNEIFYPGQAARGNTPNFGGAVDVFADFGIWGVLVFSFFSVQAIGTALASYIVFRSPGFDFSKISMVTVAVMISEFAPLFGNLLPLGIYLVVLYMLVLLARFFAGIFGEKRRRLNIEHFRT